MNRPFWSLRQAENDSCESIRPLLSLYADRMASPEEMRRIEAHLPGCDGCRESLSWMQATHRALAARPVALPPSDLHSRIAQAIAASSAAPVSSVPGLLRPARSFTLLRPGYAAAVSLTVLSIALSVSYPLWHPASEAGVKPALRPVYSASAPPIVKPHSAALPHSVLAHSRTASVAPETQKPAPHLVVVPRKTAPASVVVPQERVAATVPAPATHSAPVYVQAVSHSSAVTHEKIASIQAAPTEKRQPQALKTLKAPSLIITPKLPDAPLVASREKELPPVTVEIEKATVTTQPLVQTASLASTSHNFLDGANAYARAMRSEAYGKTEFVKRQASGSFANAVHSVASDPAAVVYPVVYSSTAAK